MASETYPTGNNVYAAPSPADHPALKFPTFAEMLRMYLAPVILGSLANNSETVTKTEPLPFLDEI